MDAQKPPVPGEVRFNIYSDEDGAYNLAFEFYQDNPNFHPWIPLDKQGYEDFAALIKNTYWFQRWIGGHRDRLCSPPLPENVVYFRRKA